MELNVQCFGIDHWQGDEQAGFYGDDVFDQVHSYNDEFYGESSILLRMNFDEALDQFDDGSIDLLHIDGSHDYESVKNDFYDWLPKMKREGIILLHDVLVKRADYGVMKLWKELCIGYKTKIDQSGHGLGVISLS
jgi:hypothetical protein